VFQHSVSDAMLEHFLELLVTGNNNNNNNINTNDRHNNVIGPTFLWITPCRILTSRPGDD
jgi:hypothetical protein